MRWVMKVFPRSGARATPSPRCVRAAPSSGGARAFVSSAFFAATFAFVCAGVAPACDCQFGGAATCQAFWQADAIFAGTVVGVSRTTADQGNYKEEMRAVRFSMSAAFRGVEPARQIEVLTGLGGGDCGYAFRQGETYLVYAHLGEKDHKLYTGICTRTRPLAEAEEDLAYIRALPQMEAVASVFGVVGSRRHEWKDGEEWYKPVAAAELTVEGQGARAEARTDAQGRFRVAGLAPGAYKVKVRVPEGLTYWKIGDDGTASSDVQLAARGCAETWFVFDADTRVAGRVLDAEGQPVANLKIQMRGAPSDPKNGNTFLYAQTDAGGRFEFQTVPPGDYWLGVRLLDSSGEAAAPYPRTYYPGVQSKASAQSVRVREGERGGDVELRLPPRLAERTVEGSVVWADGRPAPGVNIYQSLMEEGEMTAFQSLRADERGRFTLKLYEGLAYRVSAYPQNTTGNAAQSPWAEVPPAGTQPVRLVLPLVKK